MPLTLMSFLVGLLIGLTSMGGAALMAPFLVLVLGIPIVDANRASRRVVRGLRACTISLEVGYPGP